jgi:O-antigen/teichoic acid export membrane protein
VSIQSRLVKGLGANWFGQLVNILAQAVTPPVLIYNWGVEGNGQWIVLSSTLAYFSMTDVGLTSASATELSLCAAREDFQSANRVAQSTVAFVLSIATFTAAITGLLVYGTSAVQWLGLRDIAPRQIAHLIMLFLGAALASQLQASQLMYFRCQGGYAISAVYATVIRALELLATLLAASLGGFLATAATIACFRVAAAVWLAVQARRRYAWIESGFRQARWQCLANLWRPSVANLSYAFGSALTVQGTVLLIGKFIGPTAVTIFAAHRTIANLTSQALSSLNLAFWPELSAAYGAGDLPACRHLHRTICQWAIWLSVFTIPCSIAAYVWFLPRWTLGAVATDPTLVAAFLLLTLLRICWTTNSIVATACNRHSKSATIYLAGAALSMILVAVTLPMKSLTVIALALCVVEGIVAVAIVFQSLSITEDRLGPFLRQIKRFPPLGVFRRHLSRSVNA